MYRSFNKFLSIDNMEYINHMNKSKEYGTKYSVLMKLMENFISKHPELMEESIDVINERFLKELYPGTDMPITATKDIYKNKESINNHLRAMYYNKQNYRM